MPPILHLVSLQLQTSDIASGNTEVVFPFLVCLLLLTPRWGLRIQPHKPSSSYLRPLPLAHTWDSLSSHISLVSFLFWDPVQRTLKKDSGHSGFWHCPIACHFLWQQNPETICFLCTILQYTKYFYIHYLILASWVSISLSVKWDKHTYSSFIFHILVQIFIRDRTASGELPNLI